MFLRKITVMVVPLLLALVLCLVMPVLSGLGFWSNVLRGLLLGIGLALLLPLSGAGRKKEPFANLLWIPALLLALVVVYQYLASSGIMSTPALSLLTTDNAQTVLVESAFVGYMACHSLRTRK